MLHVYEIALPVKCNAGKSLNGAHEAFRIILLHEFGGYTKLPSAEGAWYCEKLGRVMYDVMVSYRIAVDELHSANGPGVMSYLAGRAGNLFPDQEAFFVSRVGIARILSNGHVPRQDKATRGAGKTDQGFESAALQSPEAPAKSSTPLRPFEYHIADVLLKDLQGKAAIESAKAWRISEAMRCYRINPTAEQLSVLVETIKV